MLVNHIYCGECSEVMSQFPDACIDMTCTSPPYDNLRDYNGYTFQFEQIAQQLYRVTKQGGIVVWIVADATKNGSETCTAFRQALFCKEIGFKLHDTMISAKTGCAYPHRNRYHDCFEYMFVFSKGKLCTFNGIRDRINKHAGRKIHGTDMCGPSGKRRRCSGHGKRVPPLGLRYNFWLVSNSRGGKNTYHPAVCSRQLAHDHILTWSNEGDVILDPLVGSGTTCLAAMKLNRKYVGIDISQEYCDLAQANIDKEIQQRDSRSANAATMRQGRPQLQKKRKKDFSQRSK